MSGKTLAKAMKKNLKKPLTINGKLMRNPYPSTLTVDTHSYCNVRCQMCPYEKISKEVPTGFMEVSLYEQIVNDYADLAKQYGFRPRMNFCNMSEPFVDKHVVERTAYSLERGIDVYFNTSGSLLSPEIVDALNKVGFQGDFILNIPAISPEVYEGITGLRIEKTLKNVHYLLEHYPKEKIRVQALVVNWPPEEYRKVRNYWKQTGVRVKFSLPNSRAGLLPEFFGKRHRKVMMCGSGRVLNQMVVNILGEVVLCCQDMKQQVIVGSLRDQSVEEVWNGSHFQEVLEKIYLPEHDGLDLVCAECEYALPSRSAWSRFRKNLAHEVRRGLYLWRTWL